MRGRPAWPAVPFGDMAGSGLRELELHTRWMRLCAPCMAPVFRWNHEGVMRSGDQGLPRRPAAGPRARRGRASRQCCRIFERKSLARGERSSGLPKKSSFEQSSTILPASMKMTLLLTRLAKPISCVTHIMVMPS